MYLPQTSNKQLIYAYKVQQNVSTDSYSKTYPSCRPLKIYRKQGISASAPTSVISTQLPCNTSCAFDKMVGLPLKMLAKKINGQSNTCCADTQGPVGSKQGNVMSFSGNAKLRSAVQPKNNAYYSDTINYLRSRGNAYSSKLNFKTIPNTDYSNPANSSYYEIQEGPLSCTPTIKTTYKRNNVNFSSQGAVSSDTRLLKLKYDTINKNNASFKNEFNVVLNYSPDPIFSQKNKVNKCVNNAKCGMTTTTTPIDQANSFNP